MYANVQTVNVDRGSPEASYPVSIKLVVVADQGHVLEGRLCHQQPIKRIAVVPRQLLYTRDMGVFNG